ncbi:MAG TPA: peptide ABC transporter substrate-binding protein [Victivallales bacterium]|nr:peptide ABC transporter substrate-binding protein [Victivallales bacterium]
MIIKKISLILFTGLAMLLMFGMNSAFANTKITYNLGQESKTIDPQLVAGRTGAAVDATCMEGLTRSKINGQVVPGIAKKWDISKDGKIYTFYLRKDAKWSNGEPVTAQDFVFGIKRALMPSTASVYAYFLYNIKNAEAYNTGKIKDFSNVGVKALNDHTVQYTLNGPCTYFLQVVGASTSFPCNEKFYNKVKKNYALTPKDMIYDGPWKLTKWITGAGGKFVFKKNPYYWNKKNIKIDELQYDLIVNKNTAANMFRTNQLDFTSISGNQLIQFKDSKDLIQKMDGGAKYLQFNLLNKYLKNQKIREAITLAINRQELTKFILKDGSVPAYAWVPPGIKGPDGKTFREAYGNYNIKENVVKAKKLLAEGIKELGVKAPIKLKILTANDNASQKVCVFIQQQLRKNLGIDVSLDVETYQGRLQKMTDHSYQISYCGWGPDYNDPMTFLNLWITNGTNNSSHFSNRSYDKLINETMKSSSDSKRMVYMHQAEEILMKELPVAPLFYSSKNYLVKPWLKGVLYRTTSPNISFYWAHVQK